MILETQQSFIEQNSNRTINIETTQDVLSGAKNLFDSCQYLGNEGIRKVSDALFYTHVAHRYFSEDPKKAFRSDKKEYTTHLIATAQILADLRCDQTTLISALLHDTLENTTVTQDMLIGRFGKEVADAVDTVTKVAGSPVTTMVNLLKGLAENPRAVLVKLADRLHNMRTIGFLKKSKQRVIAQQTFEIFAPLARELGLDAIADELYDSSIAVLWKNHSDKAKKIIRTKYETGLSSKLFSPIQTALGEVDVAVLKPNAFDFMKFEEDHVEVDDRDEIPVDIACQSQAGWQDTLAFFQGYLIGRNLSSEVNGGFLHLKQFPFGERKFSIKIYSPDGLLIKRASLATLCQADELTTEENKRVIVHAKRKLEGPIMLLQQVQKEGNKAILRYFEEQIKAPLIRVITPQNEIRVLSAGSNALEYAFSISADLALKATKAVINGEGQEIDTKLNAGDRVDIKASHKWNVSVAMLDQVRSKNNKRTIKRALRDVLRYADYVLGDMEKDDKFDRAMIRMGYIAEDGKVMSEELSNDAKKIRRDAIDRGEEMLVVKYKELYSEEPKVDLVRGWEQYTSKYTGYDHFLQACGLDQSNDEEVIYYLRLVHEHEKLLKKIYVDLPDFPGASGRIDVIVGLFANIVGIGIKYNITRQPPGSARVNLILETKLPDNINVEAELQDFANMMLRFYKPESVSISNELYCLEFDIPSGINPDPLPVSNLISSCGLAMRSLVFDGSKVSITCSPMISDSERPITQEEVNLVRARLERLYYLALLAKGLVS